MHNSSRFVVATWALVGCAVPASPPAATAEPAAEPEPPRPIEVIARVNGEPITRAAFDAEVARLTLRYRSSGHQLPPSIDARVRESVLQRMVQDALVTQRASELHISIGEAELDAALTEHEGRFRSPSAFAAYLQRAQTTEEQVRADLRRDMLRDRVVAHVAGQVRVTDDEVRRHFEENRARYVQREQIEASRILIRVAPDARSELVAEARDLAEKLRNHAKPDPAAFAELARQHSHAPEASRGGDLGWLTRGRMPPSWDQVAFALEPGTISAPISTDSGFEIIAVWARQPERPRSLEEVADSIRASLRATKAHAKRGRVLRDLEAAARVEVLEPVAVSRP